MWNREVFLVLIYSLVCESFKPPLMFGGRPRTGFRIRDLDDKVKITLDSVPYTTPINFTQKIDHFDNGNTATFQQQYWHSDKFAKPNGPQFLMLGGEGPASYYDVVYESYPHIQWASQVGAGLWTLEHRFYGKSRPFPNQTTENLKYLTSRQYLADVADFIKYQNQQLKLTNPKWVVFGGSYSGALALWFRELYPDVAVGAVGSSGPVYAKLDFYEYLQVVDASLRTYDNNCAENTRSAFEKLSTYMTSDAGRAILTYYFTLVPAFKDLNITYEDIENFYSSAIGYYQNAVQYSRVNANVFITGASIPEVCKIMNTPAKDPVMNILWFVAYMSDTMDGGFIGLDNKWQDYIEYIQYTGYEDEGRAAARSWTWQTCNEFGYFQSTDAGGQIFGSKIPDNLYIDMCTEVFGPQYNIDYITNAVANTLKQYGGRDNYKGTNVVAPNGSLDPWHALGLYKSNDPSVVTYLIDGTAHCADMEPPSDSDNDSMKKLRIIIFENIKKWIGVSTEEKIVKKEKQEISNEKNEILGSFNQKRIKDASWNPKIKLNEDLADFYPDKIDPKTKHRPYKFGRFRYGNLPDPDDLAKDFNSTANWITQQLDHFDNANTKTWRQRWWRRSDFYKPGGPIFLMISGESTAGSKWVENDNVTYLTIAKALNADVYMVEHRYYGYSRPTGDQSTGNLKYLSSEQALADLAVFIDSINKAQSYQNPKWVTFGGSYSGALSAWFRQKYPDYTVGAVGSSGPVYAKVDFFEYLQVVEKSLRTYSDDCANNVGLAFVDIQHRLTTVEGRSQLNDIFKPSHLFDKNPPTVKDIQTFMASLIGSYQGAVQYSGDNTDAAIGMGIKEVCDIMLNSSYPPIQNVRRAFDLMNGGADVSVDNHYDDDVQFYKSNTFDINTSAGRSWIWQTCTEFGYFQSTDLGQNIFGSAVPVDYYIDFCTDVYGPSFNRSSIDNSIAFTQAGYGGIQNYTATNVVLPNGSLDPWHALGLYTDGTQGVISILINGTAHCADMYPARDTDVPGLMKARDQILQLVTQWKNLDDAFSKQRDNMQNYLEDLNSMVTKNNNVYSSTFKQINDGLAAYMGDGEVSSEVTTQTICNQISQLANSLPDVVFLTEKYFDFDPMNPVTPGICQQQLFSLVGTVNIGNGNPSPVGTAQNGIQTITNGVGNTANTVGGKIGDAANTVGEKVGNAVNTAGENLGNLAGNIQGGISSALNG
ncbi:hypothetical protein FO519_005857 [Halicephalobus sp. NKZ332]|nr:hypothetical protein FO519_005857 [Halicephalobus sp. NKZ332]